MGFFPTFLAVVRHFEVLIWITNAPCKVEEFSCANQLLWEKKEKEKRKKEIHQEMTGDVQDRKLEGYH